MRRLQDPCKLCVREKICCVKRGLGRLIFKISCYHWIINRFIEKLVMGWISIDEQLAQPQQVLPASEL